MTYGLCNALASLGFGILEMYTGRQLYEAFAMASIIFIQTTLYLTFDGTPLTHGNRTGMFIIAGFCGLSDSVFRVLNLGNTYYVSHTYLYSCIIR